MATDDYCVVCADAMDWTGYGPCGHKEACSRCVARLRFVLDDKKCVICREESPDVFFTRFSGDFTARLGPEQFPQLKERAKHGELQQLPEVNGYFDDPDHYAYIKKLCSYTHPVLAQGPGGDSPAFNSLQALKRKVADVAKLNFCDLCLTGRKVFISEQVLYTKPDLERHMRTGDDSGPLAESGFTGHPNCRFCRRRFYDSSELYKHMESRHEHCFLCRRMRPDKYVYYRDYEELDGHFRADHHACPHPACLERKFVVFAQEAELKRHFATEHGDEMNMSRAQRRQALTIPIDLQFTRGGDRNMTDLPPSRPGVVIGGGGAGSIGPPPNRHGRGNNSMRHSRSDPAMAAAVQASIDTSQAEAAQRSAAAAPTAAPSEERLGSVTFGAEDFPSVSGAARPAMGGVSAPLGTWVGASSAGPSTSGAGVRPEDFPALPNATRAQRKRLKEQSAAQSLAARLGVGRRDGPPKVLHRAAPTRAAAASSSADGASSSAAAGVRHSHSTPSLAATASSDADGYDSAEEGLDGASHGQQQRRQTAEAAMSIVDEFPALASAPVAPAHPGWMPVRSRAPKPRTSSSSAGTTAAAAIAAGPGRPLLQPQEFPSLAATVPAVTPPRKPARARNANSGGIRIMNAAQPQPAAAAPAAVVSAAEAVAAAGGVSESLKAANKALIDKIRKQLDEGGFASFKAQSAGFMRGDVAAAEYHSDIVSLGLLPLVPELAALCPEPQKRSALMAAHRAFLESDRAQDMRSLGSSWVPPEAGLAAAASAEAHSSWECARCTLLNAPHAGRCEVCAAPKPKAGAGVPAGSGASTSGKGNAASSSTSSWSGAGRPGASSSDASPAAAAAGTAAPAAASTGRTSSRPASANGVAGSSHANRAASPGAAMLNSNQFPSLGGSRSGASSSQQAPQQQPPAQQPSSQQPSKKKKAEKKSLQELMSSGQVHPQNAWTQQRSAGPAATPGLGEWGKGGGKKLVKQMDALGMTDHRRR